MAAVYEMDLDALAEHVIASADEKALKKAHRAWKRAFLEGEDYDLEPRTYKACDVLKQAYRASNAEINKLRHAVNDATLGAIREMGRVYEGAKCRIWATPSFLIIQLPSGRRLLYAKPRIEQDAHIDPENGEITHRDYITYLTARGKGWIRERAWSGLFIENIVQAIANDVLRAALRSVHADALTINRIRDYLHLVEGAETALSLHVHDEVALDVPKGSYPLERLIELITTKLVAANAWMRGLPLAAAGWVGPTYHKG
jgi:DNA polymerase